MISLKEKNYLFSLLKDLGREAENIKTRKIQYEQKKDGSPLSEADNLVNKRINEFIKKTGYQNIISEENKQVDFVTRSSWEYFWLVDPIDGTKEFINKGDDYTINIALCKENRPIFSIVYAPGKKELFHAEKNKGAFKNEKRIYSYQDQKTWRVVASKSHMTFETKNFIDKTCKDKKVELKNYGSSLKICKVADGTADIYPRFGPTMEWDTCAAHLILSESGGELVCSSNGHVLEYNKENLLNPFFIAFAHKVKPELFIKSFVKIT